jgi:CubicO group peptidase (beta-lactamase class C family)
MVSKTLLVAIAFVFVTANAFAPTFAQGASTFALRATADKSAGEPDTARMEQVIQSHVSAGTFMGTVLVARDGKVVLDRGYGMANVELDVPNTPATKFRLGSITKQFTAAAILLLEERGKLKLDDRLKTYLPDVPMSWERITVYNLLTHTAGIANFTALTEYGDAKLRLTPVDKTIASLRDRPLDFGPGEQMSYSNSGYIVLGAIIEKVSGQSYEKFVTDNLFSPLGMTDSGYDSNTAIIKRRASGYVRTPSGLANATYIHMSIPHAAGALYSTTADLLKWEQALFEGKVVSKASLDRMITPFKNDYALGLTSTLERGRRVIAHGGGIDGFNTMLAYYPDSRTVIVVLSNVAGGVPGTLSGQLATLMHGETVTLTSERKEITLPAATLAKYAGTYELAPAVTITVTVDGDRAFAQLTGQGRNPIFPQSDTMFFLKAVDAQLEFAADAGAVVLHQNGRSRKAPRK